MFIYLNYILFVNLLYTFLFIILEFLSIFYAREFFCRKRNARMKQSNRIIKNTGISVDELIEKVFDL